MTDSDSDSAAADDLRRWLGEHQTTVTPTDGNARTHRRRAPHRVALLGAILLPWVLLAVVVARGTAPGEDGPRPVTPTPSASADPPLPSSSGTGDDAADPLPTGSADRAAPGPSTSTSPSTPGGVGPTAVRLVRDAVTRAGDRTSALDSATAEPPTPLSGDAWIVRVHAVVLRGDERRWHAANHEIWAVPIGRRGRDLVGLDEPWRLAIAPARTVATAWQPTTVDDDAARAALRAVGIDVDRVRAERHPTLALIVRVRAGRRWVWLRTAPDVSVLGTAPEDRSQTTP